MSNNVSQVNWAALCPETFIFAKNLGLVPEFLPTLPWQDTIDQK